MNTTELVVEIGPEKNSGSYEIWTHDLCDTGAVPTELTSQLRAGHYVGFKLNGLLGPNIVTSSQLAC